MFALSETLPRRKYKRLRGRTQRAGCADNVPEEMLRPTSSGLVADAAQILCRVGMRPAMARHGRTGVIQLEKGFTGSSCMRQ